MSPARLLEHFDRLIDTPEAVPRLRRFILDLAVRGKLVEQDPKDEPAGELLKQIQAEKTKLVKAGEIRSQEPFESIERSEMPFEIPPTWEWVPATFPAYLISDMGKKVQTKDVLESGAFPVVDQGKVFIRGYCNDQHKVIHVDAPIILFGDHTRETKLIDFDFVVGADGVKLLHPLGVLTEFYYLALRWLPLDSRGYGRHFKLLRAAAIPLPPLAEQRRIVAKVDELMALCDELEAAQTKREKRRDRLVAATLHGLNNGDATQTPGAPTTFEESARFYFNYLPRLTTRPEHIHQLRKTILNLAVRGKLVPQDSRNEPVATLLGRTRSANDQLKSADRAIRQESVTQEGGKIQPLQLPSGWEWVRIEDILLDDSRNGYSKKPDEATNGVPILRISAGTIRRDGIVAEEEYKLIGGITRKLQEQFSLKPGDLLACRFNGNRDFVGRLSLYTGYLGLRQIFPDKLIRLRLSTRIVLPELVRWFAKSAVVREDIETYCATTVGNWGISASNLKLVRIPIPPIAEQHRIVAKIDELIGRRR